jgi:hypothetical protein
MEEAGTAVTQAHNLADYQAVGVRCREALLELISVAQDAAMWTDTPPQRANFRAWTEIICNDLLPGDTNKERRGALKGALESAWTFSNWLTHSKSATWIDTDMAHSLTQHASGMATSSILRELRSVPEECPNCGSPHLDPEQGENSRHPAYFGNDRAAPTADGLADPFQSSTSRMDSPSSLAKAKNPTSTAS